MKRKKRNVNEKAADWMSQVIRVAGFYLSCAGVCY